MKNQIIISYKHSSISWAKDFSDDFDIFVYNKGKRPLKFPWLAHVEKLPNVGQAAHSYLYHIVNNYDKLAPITVFLRDDPTVQNRGVPELEMLRNKISKDNISHIGQIAVSNSDGTPHHPGLPIQKYWEEMFVEPVWGSFAFVIGGQYSVPASFIQKRPLEWWEKQLNHPDAQTNPIPEPDCDPPWAWCMERLWPAIYDGDVEGKL